MYNVLEGTTFYSVTFLFTFKLSGQYAALPFYASFLLRLIFLHACYFGIEIASCDIMVMTRAIKIEMKPFIL